ncbi:Integrin alpha-L CD11 antigen-like family member A [Triplophysa tibetana]|uniref:Integrin alpha-L CD11 antigen-like family member A n=1 Tax=Triplophysa tibetana TaxID=1572043 RepID=A0A5A9PT71_9TELE|nr:Integrin alpha-L CD11 antigen-like family member A [Triplophysa tibetana]
MTWGQIFLVAPNRGGSAEWSSRHEQSSGKTGVSGTDRDPSEMPADATARRTGEIPGKAALPSQPPGGACLVMDGMPILNQCLPQIGSYFGAELCVVDLNADKDTDLLLVSAPTYTEGDREGKVFVYYSERNGFSYSYTELVGMGGQRGRFGSSVSSPTDLNGDRFNDVVIGAPLEDDGQGSIYIFNGKVGGIVPTYSQRIGGSSVRPGLRLFGISLSQSSLDQSNDNLPDIAVGSMGTVLLLRSPKLCTHSSRPAVDHSAPLPVLVFSAVRGWGDCPHTVEENLYSAYGEAASALH